MSKVEKTKSKKTELEKEFSTLKKQIETIQKKVQKLDALRKERAGMQLTEKEEATLKDYASKLQELLPKIEAVYREIQDSAPNDEYFKEQLNALQTICDAHWNQPDTKTDYTKHRLYSIPQTDFAYSVKEIPDSNQFWKKSKVLNEAKANTLSQVILMSQKVPENLHNREIILEQPTREELEEWLINNDSIGIIIKHQGLLGSSLSTGKDVTYNTATVMMYMLWKHSGTHFFPDISFAEECLTNQSYHFRKFREEVRELSQTGDSGYVKVYMPGAMIMESDDESSNMMSILEIEVGGQEGVFDPYMPYLASAYDFENSRIALVKYDK